MLKNAYLDAKFGFDTAENEPSEVRGFLIGVGGVIMLVASLKTLGYLPGPRNLSIPFHSTAFVNPARST